MSRYGSSGKQDLWDAIEGFISDYGYKQIVIWLSEIIADILNNNSEN